MNPARSPIIDLRVQRPWRRSLPARLATLGLWGAALALVGPVLITPTMAAAAIGIGLAGLIGAPLARRLQRRRGRRRGIASTAPVPLDPSRQQLASWFALAETDLFRARHASVCTVHHDGDGRLVAIERSGADRISASTDCHAHPVG